jgi:hypothetical protein
VVAPALITASKIRHRKSSSERPASSAENSTSSVYSRPADRLHGLLDDLVGRHAQLFLHVDRAGGDEGVDAAGLRRGLIASPARRMSFSLARASEQTVESLMASAIGAWHRNRREAAAKPASMTSTRMRSSWRAMRSFSSLVIEAPGLCSPSRKVVSKMTGLFRNSGFIPCGGAAESLNQPVAPGVPVLRFTMRTIAST